MGSYEYTIGKEVDLKAEQEKTLASSQLPANFILKGSKIECIYNLPDDLWNVEIDEIKICEVINNLIINSKHAMPDGGKLIISGKNINLKKRNQKHFKPGKYVCISIHDNGIGMPDEIHSKIFNPFFTTKIKGSGLGLPTSYLIMQKHNGYIDFESIDGKETKFNIYLKASKKKIVKADNVIEDF